MTSDCAAATAARVSQKKNQPPSIPSSTAWSNVSSSSVVWSRGVSLIFWRNAGEIGKFRVASRGTSTTGAPLGGPQVEIEIPFRDAVANANEGFVDIPGMLDRAAHHDDLLDFFHGVRPLLQGESDVRERSHRHDGEHLRNRGKFFGPRKSATGPDHDRLQKMEPKVGFEPTT